MLPATENGSPARIEEMTNRSPDTEKPERPAISVFFISNKKVHNASVFAISPSFGNSAFWAGRTDGQQRPLLSGSMEFFPLYGVAQ